MSFKYKIRILLFAIAFCVLTILLYLAIVPFGKIVYENDFSRDNFFISKITPDTRLGESSGDTIRIKANPVYFSLKTQRKFSQAILSLSYKDNLENGIIETGTLVDNTLWRYDLKPVENVSLSSICDNWYKKLEGDLIFCQRKETFVDLEEYLASSTDMNKLAVYNYDLDKKYTIELYKKSEQEKNIEEAIVGQFQFYTYIKDETLEFSFLVIDQNKNTDADRVDVNLYYDDVLIDNVILYDDGNESDNGQFSEPRKLQIKTARLPEGVYKLELRANNDIITQKITTKQSKIAFVDSLNLAKRDKEASLYTDSSLLRVTTIYPDRLNIIRVASSSLEIQETYKQFSLELDNSIASTGLKVIDIPKVGQAISGNGVFSFSSEQFFDPKIKKIDDNLDFTNIDYLIARVPVVQAKGDWKQVDVPIDLSRAYRENKTYSFIISIPNLELASEKYVEIDKMQIELEGLNIWGLIKEKIKK
ncbi:hypothetical protein C0583_01375 [Candidatus Parcubacteria bacterium]|nr:MAG: hypothetical protein C0583_01375 [Candidatus Parcubacteria bacterium]